MHQHLFPEGLTIHRAQNGWVVMPPLRGDYHGIGQSHVFTDARSLAAWVEGWARGVEVREANGGGTA